MRYLCCCKDNTSQHSRKISHEVSEDSAPSCALGGGLLSKNALQDGLRGKHPSYVRAKTLNRIPDLHISWVTLCLTRLHGRLHTWQTVFYLLCPDETNLESDIIFSRWICRYKCRKEILSQAICDHIFPLAPALNQSAWPSPLKPTIIPFLDSCSVRLARILGLVLHLSDSDQECGSS